MFDSIRRTFKRLISDKRGVHADAAAPSSILTTVGCMGIGLGAIGGAAQGVCTLTNGMNSTSDAAMHAVATPIPGANIGTTQQVASTYTVGSGGVGHP